MQDGSQRTMIITIAEELVLLPVADNDDGAAAAILILSLRCLSPVVTPVTLHSIQCRHERVSNKLMGQSAIVAIVHFNDPETILCYERR